MRRGRHSTSSSSTFEQPSSSHLNDDDDGNGEGTSCASTPSPIRYVNSLTNQVPHFFQNPPNIDPHLEPFYTLQTEIINRQVQLRDEQSGGLTTIPSRPSYNFCILTNTFWNLKLQTPCLLLQSISYILNHKLFSIPSPLIPQTSMDTQASSSHGFKKIKLTILPPKQLFINLTSDNENLSTPSPTTTSSSPTPPNAPSKTTSTKETTSSHENTSSSF
ncbi:hypothetical protein Tco_1360443 [Tanacetum coccineum]